LNVREAATLLGVSHGTLSRIERGEKMAGETLAKILAWLLSK
jgi:transcriptional regulator with XRE-family HTH domain